MKLQTFAVVGHDWGARAAYIASVLAPERIVAIFAVTTATDVLLQWYPLALVAIAIPCAWAGGRLREAPVWR